MHGFEWPPDTVADFNKKGLQPAACRPTLTKEDPDDLTAYQVTQALMDDILTERHRAKAIEAQVVDLKAKIAQLEELAHGPYDHYGQCDNCCAEARLYELSDGIDIWMYCCNCAKAHEIGEDYTCSKSSQ